ncbi:MAG: Crp/Fnr family transcriptional regulator [Lewinellaceae bacterium]|nr:Crp/Fnr family transcriptional regulator [Lewinellaceae bacterium]
MKIEELRNLLHRHFPLLNNPELVDIIAERAVPLALPVGDVLLHPGDPVKLIPLVVKGTVKVARAGTAGHEVLLYHIQPGESCAMTLSSCLKREKSKVKATVQQSAEIIGIPAEVAYMLGRKFPGWYDFVLDSYAQRFQELLHMVDEIGFASLDQRLLHYLREQQAMQQSTVLHRSHQEIADDLGSARAVISRLLKQMERKGMVTLLRGRIKILSLVLPE